MWSNGVYFGGYIWELLYVYKVEILAGAFAGVAVYSYFYRQLIMNEGKIYEILTKIKELESLENIIDMGNEDQLQFLWKSIEKLEGTLGNFKSEIRNDIVGLRNDISSLKTSTAVIKTKLALYVGIAVFVVSLVIKVSEKLIF